MEPDGLEAYAQSLAQTGQEYERVLEVLQWVRREAYEDAAWLVETSPFLLKATNLFEIGKAIRERAEEGKESG